MYSEDSLRKFVTERLTAAAEDIFVVFKSTIVEYEKELERQRKLLDYVLKPQVNLYRIDVPQQLLCKENEVLPDQQLCEQERDSSPDQEGSLSKLPQQPICEEDEGLIDPVGSFDPVPEGPEPPQIKEEPEEPCRNQEGEQLILKEETGTFKLNPAYEESCHSKPQLKHGQMQFSYNSHIAENQSLEGRKHGDSKSNRNKDPNIIPLISHNTGMSGIHFGPLQDQQSYKCDSCDEVFRSKSSYREHHHVHTGKGTHSCQICGETFSLKSLLVLHTRRHKDNRPFSCKMCKDRFFKLSDLRKHSLFHTDERPFKCVTCGKSYKFKSDLNVHMRTHIGERGLTPAASWGKP